MQQKLGPNLIELLGLPFDSVYGDGGPRNPVLSSLAGDSYNLTLDNVTPLEICERIEVREFLIRQW